MGDIRALSNAAVGNAGILNLLTIVVPSGRTLIILRETLGAVVTATDAPVNADFGYRLVAVVLRRAVYNALVDLERCGTEEVPVFIYHNDTNAVVNITIDEGLILASVAANTYAVTILYAIR